jgi:HEAT repeat protein
MTDQARVVPGSEIGSLLFRSKPGSSDRRKLLRQLASAGTPSNLVLLGEYLASDDARDGVAAVQSLQHIGTESAIATLVEGLSTARPLVGAYVARALISLGARSELPAILAYLRDGTGDNASNKQFVISAMRKMPHVSEVPVLSDALYDRHFGLRKSAARGLLAIRAEESAQALQAAADELGFWRGRQARRVLRALR